MTLKKIEHLELFDDTDLLIPGYAAKAMLRRGLDEVFNEIDAQDVVELLSVKLGLDNEEPGTTKKIEILAIINQKE